MSTRRLEQLSSPAPSMPDFAFGTGRASALSASALPPNGVLPDPSPPAEVLSVLLSPTPRPEGRSNEGRPQSSPSRSFQPNQVSLTRWARFLYGDRDATNQEEGSRRKGSWASAVQERLREGSGRKNAHQKKRASTCCSTVLHDAQHHCPISSSLTGRLWQTCKTEEHARKKAARNVVKKPKTKGVPNRR